MTDVLFDFDLLPVLYIEFSKFSARRIHSW